MIRYIAWAIPAIGFIGTVRHIGDALLQAHKAVSGDITGVTSSLGIAFNATFVALSLTIVLMFFLHQLQQMQEQLRARHRSLDRSASDPAHAGEIACSHSSSSIPACCSPAAAARRSEVLTEAPGVAVLEDDRTLTGDEAAERVRLQAAARADELLARPEHRTADAAVAARAHDRGHRVRASRSAAESVQVRRRGRAAGDSRRLQPRAARAAARCHQRNRRARGGSGRRRARRVQSRTRAGARAAPGSGAASGDPDRARVCGRRALRSEAQPLRDRLASRRARHPADADAVHRRDVHPQDALRSAARCGHRAAPGRSVAGRARPTARTGTDRRRHAVRRSAARNRDRARAADRRSSNRTMSSCCAWCRARASPACRSQLRVSQRIAALPGLLERFGTLRDCEVKLLPRGAAALGALEHEAAISRPDSLALVYHLPIARAAGGEVARTSPKRRRRRCARRICCSRAAPGEFPTSRW